MKLPAFAYAAPETLEEALALKAAHGEEALFLAGGQSLVPLLALRLASPALLVDLNRVVELEYIREEQGWVHIGAMTRHCAVEQTTELCERLPLLTDALPLIGHRAIRNRGTVGGTVAHADPAGEWPTLALALDGMMVINGPRGARTVGADGFFEGPFSTALAPDEILQEIRVRLPQGAVGTAFIEFARRHGDFGLAGVAAVLAVDADERVSSARIALLGVGGTPARAKDAERALEGRALTQESMRAAAAACREAVQPPTDVHGSAAYRRHLLGVLVGRTLGLAGERASRTAR
jgi:carbon-monoxide dehydrogenase medium subunit